MKAHALFSSNPRFIGKKKNFRSNAQYLKTIDISGFFFSTRILCTKKLNFSSTTFNDLHFFFLYVELYFMSNPNRPVDAVFYYNILMNNDGMRIRLSGMIPSSEKSITTIAASVQGFRQCA